MLFMPDIRRSVLRGTRRWLVTWQTAPAGWDAMTPEQRDEEGGIDAADNHYRAFPTKGLAVAFARQVCVGSFFGVSDVRQQIAEHLDCGIGEWEDADDRITYCEANKDGTVEVVES